MTKTKSHSLARRAATAGAAIVSALTLGAGVAGAQPLQPALPTQDQINDAVLTSHDNLQGQVPNLPEEFLSLIHI